MRDRIFSYFCKIGLLCVIYFHVFSALFCAAADSTSPAVVQDFLQHVLTQGIDPVPAAAALKTHLGDGVQDQNQYEFLRVCDHIDYLLFLKDRIAFLERNNEALDAFLRSSIHHRGIEQDDIDHLSQEQRQVFDFFYPTWDMPSNGVLLDVSSVAMILKEAESILIMQQKKMQMINDALRSLKIQTVAHERHLREAQERDAHVNRFSEITQTMKQREMVIEQQSQQIDDLRQQLDAVTLASAVFKDRLQSTSEKIHDVVKEMATISMDLYQQQQQAADKKQQAQQATLELREAQERLQLVQHIIQEKDQHILKLEDEIAQVQRQFAEFQQSPHIAVGELRLEMADAVQNLQAQMEHSQAKIQRLEDRVQEVALVKAQLESEVMEKRLMVSFLQRQAEQKDEMIADLEREFHSRVRQLSDLHGVIKIYQLKLREYKQLLEEKDALTALEKDHERSGEALPVSKQGDDGYQEVFPYPERRQLSDRDITDASRKALDQIYARERRERE